MPEIHPDIAHLSFLLGSWAGTGRGRYPTIESFEYNEEITFGHVGKPFLAYTQRTRHASTGLPLHAESGYLRPVGTDRVEFLVVQPSGIMESYEGELDGTLLSLESVSVTTTATAKDVTKVVRTIRVDPAAKTLSYTMDMAAVGLELQHHLAAELTYSG
jgi:hypothetical protein